MEKYEHSRLSASQHKSIVRALDRLSNEASMAPDLAKKDADDLRQFINMMHALAFICATERVLYLSEIDTVILGEG